MTTPKKTHIRRSTKGGNELEAWAYRLGIAVDDITARLGLPELTSNCARNWITGWARPTMESRRQIWSMTGIDPASWDEDGIDTRAYVTRGTVKQSKRANVRQPEVRGQNGPRFEPEPKDMTAEDWDAWDAEIKEAERVAETPKAKPIALMPRVRTTWDIDALVARVNEMRRWAI